MAYIHTTSKNKHGNVAQSLEIKHLLKIVTLRRTTNMAYIHTTSKNKQRDRKSEKMKKTKGGEDR
jgi:hypothetical protein